MFGEFGMPHASEVAAQAAHQIRSGTYRNHFWWGSVVAGHLLPLALLSLVWLGLATGVAAWIGAAAGLVSLVGLYCFEYAFVMAPQKIPNS